MFMDMWKEGLLVIEILIYIKIKKRRVIFKVFPKKRTIFANN